MAHLEYDSELMTNYISAVAVPAGSHMVTVLDPTTSQPIVFALSNDKMPKLQVIKINGDGHRVLTDFGGLISGLPSTARISTFDVQQSSDFTLYLCLTVTLDESTSQLWILKPFKLTTDTPSSLPTLPPKTLSTVHKLLIGNPDAPDQSYPKVWVMLQPPDRTAIGEDIHRLEVDLSRNSSSLRKDMTLPVNTRTILDIAPASGGLLGEGLFILCEQADKQYLYVKFVRPGEQEGDAPQWSTFELVCPAGACSIASFTDYSDNFKRSCLLIGSPTGLHLFTAREATRKSAGKLISNHNGFLHAKALHVVQDEKQISVWAKNVEEELTYLTSSSSTFDAPRVATVLPTGKATSFSASVRMMSTGKQTLIAGDESGNLTLLEQSLDTGIWRCEAFYAEQGGQLMPMQTYTINMTAYDADSTPLCSGKLWIESPSLLPCTINGKRKTLTPNGGWYSLDLSGEMCLIIPTNGGITSQPLSIKKAQNAQKQELTLHSNPKIDPARKVVEALGSLASVQALTEAKTKDGRSLWEGMDKPTQEDLKNAAECFSAISQAYVSLPKDGSLVKISQPQAVAAAVDMDGFNWIKHKIDKAVGWIVRKAGGAWEFVCRIGTSIKKYALNCIEKLTEVASWVWEKLKLGWEKLTELAGFLFNWGDVLETKDTIKGLLNAGLDFAAFKVEGANDYINEFFDGLQDKVAALAGIASQEATKRIQPETGGSMDEEMKQAQQSPGCKWVTERMKNGSRSISSPSAAPKDAESVKIWEDRILPLLKSFGTLAEDLAKNMASLFYGNKNMSIDKLLANMGGTLVIDVLEIVQKFLNTIVSLVSKLVILIKNVGNFPIKWGFISDLYKWITGGGDLTIFDAISLLIAIPSTFIIKLVTGKKPPNLGKIDKKMFEDSVVTALLDSESKTTADDPSAPLAQDITTIISGCACGAAVVQLGLDNVQLLMKITHAGLGAGIDSMNPSAIINIMSMCIEGWSIIKDILEPPSDNTPGADLIKAATFVKCYRLAVNAIYIASGEQNEIADQVLLVLDLVTALTTCGLYTSSCVKELEAPEWEDYDEGKTLVKSSNNFLETVAAIGSFTAFTFKEKQPQISALGLICLQIAAKGAIITKGVEFRMDYKGSG